MHELADYTRETGELRIRVAKGNRQRLAYVQNGAAEALEAWLAVRGPEPGAALRRGKSRRTDPRGPPHEPSPALGVP
jgi:hypothetical protein